jgi:hypothetical protein
MKANKKGKILIRYYNVDREKFHDLPYEHNDTMAYTKKNQAEIIKRVLASGYSIMLRPQTYLGLTIDTDNLTMYIGVGRMSK